jgi:hypothetical protein
VSPSIAPDPRFVTRCMHGTPASRRMAHTKTASNSDATTSITAGSLTPESIAERASRPSSGCPGRDVVSSSRRRAAGSGAGENGDDWVAVRGRRPTMVLSSPSFTLAWAPPPWFPDCRS